MAKAAQQQRQIPKQETTPSSSAANMRILVVEDSDITAKLLETQIGALGHTIIHAENGQKALEILHQENGGIDIVLMDREMPVMDGLSAVHKMKENGEFRHIPIIMLTTANAVKDLQDGMDSGVFYYLTKPVDKEILRSVLSAAVREVRQQRVLAEELAKHRDSFALIDACRFRYSTLADAESLAVFISHCFDDPRKVVTGLGELLINAVEHGNLGIGFEEKTRLIESGNWRSEVERLQQLPENVGKTVTVSVARREDGVYAVIEDEGKGFDWKRYLQVDPARAGDRHGRGIAQARAASFDKLTYNEAGNRVVAFARKNPDLRW